MARQPKKPRQLTRYTVEVRRDDVLIGIEIVKCRAPFQAKQKAKGRHSIGRGYSGLEAHITKEEPPDVAKD